MGVFLKKKMLKVLLLTRLSTVVLDRGMEVVLLTLTMKARCEHLSQEDQE